MYFVYRVSFPEYNAIYIGCTNDIRRRKDQHNENARKGKSFLGRFLLSVGIKLAESDFEIIDESEDRKVALKSEKDHVNELIGTGVLILNDNYSNHCSRVGLKGSDNPSSKTYVLIDVLNHTTEVVDDVHGWCESNGIKSYKTLIGTAKRKPLMHAGRYIMRNIGEWDEMSDKDRNDLVSGAWYAKRRESSERNRRTLISGKYLVLTPSGKTVEVTNLDQYAIEHGINKGNLHATLSKGNTACGYRVLEKLT